MKAMLLLFCCTIMYSIGGQLHKRSTRKKRSRKEEYRLTQQTQKGCKALEKQERVTLSQYVQQHLGSSLSAPINDEQLNFCPAITQHKEFNLKLRAMYKTLDQQ